MAICGNCCFTEETLEAANQCTKAVSLVLNWGFRTSVLFGALHMEPNLKGDCKQVVEVITNLLYVFI